MNRREVVAHIRPVQEAYAEHGLATHAAAIAFRVLVALVPLALLSIALLRGAVVGTVAGFFGGLLVDVLTLDTLGVTALLYALAGYWAGRYGETTGRDRAHAPLLTVLVATVAIAYAGYGLHFLLGEELSARRALFETLLPTLVLNLAVARPVFALCRGALGRSGVGDRVTEVKLLG